ncbi:MAG: hypothetical protein Q4B94_01835 [Pseudomonadota bacterium]|nr:hypothetical protein [Pseudomonadota bacterium]
MNTNTLPAAGGLMGYFISEDDHRLTPFPAVGIIRPARANSRAGFSSPMQKAQQRPSHRCPALFVCPPIGGGLLRSATRFMAGGAGRACALPVPFARSANPASSATPFSSGAADSIQQKESQS